MKHLDLFSGIGGFALGLQRTGHYETVGFCEIDGYCQKLLAQNFPDVPILEDIHNVTADTLDSRGIERVDIITAGFPCQPFSVAGKRDGTSDERFLWPELFRVIAEVKPEYILLENVTGLLTIQKGLVFAGILYDLRQIEYDAEWQVIAASDVGAPHRRQRLWVIAYPTVTRSLPNAHPTRQLQPKRGIKNKRQRSGNSNSPAILTGTIKIFDYWTTEPAVGRLVNGLPHRVDRIKALGNAIVPQIAQMLGELIWQHREAQHAKH